MLSEHEFLCQVSIPRGSVCQACSCSTFIQLLCRGADVCGHGQGPINDFHVLILPIEHLPSRLL